MPPKTARLGKEAATAPAAIELFSVHKAFEAATVPVGVLELCQNKCVNALAAALRRSASQLLHLLTTCTQFAQ